MQNDLRPARGAFHRLQGVVPRTRRLPAHAMFSRRAGTTRGQRHPVSDDKGGIETDPKLTDQLRVLLLVTRQLAEKLLGA